MKTLIPLVLLVLISSLTTFGQIGVDNSSPHPSSVLDLSSTEGGLLVPRMSTQQRDAIESPANSLLVFDTSVNKYFYYDNNKWNPVSPWSASVSSADVYYETGNVGIGTIVPQYKLDVNGSINATALHISGSPLPANIFPLSNGPLAKTATGNWDDYKETGFFRGNNMTSASPSDSHLWRYVTVIGHDEGYCIQYSTDYTNDNVYVRTLFNYNWTNWKRIVTDFTPFFKLKRHGSTSYIDFIVNPNGSNIDYSCRIAASTTTNTVGTGKLTYYATGGHDFKGSITATGTITQNSDIRLKGNIGPIENALGKVKQIEGVTFTRKDLPDTEKKHIGLIADDLFNVVPELVHVPENEDEMKSVDYSSMVALLVEAIKEQQTQIEDLKQEIENLNGDSEE